jgi:hypothetical protein
MTSIDWGLLIFIVTLITWMLDNEHKTGFDFVAYLEREKAFSEKTFGPGKRVCGLMDHIRLELEEIEADPSDIYEWVDVVILALDGMWRQGYTSEEIINALVTKQGIVEARKWPNWRSMCPDKAIHHIKKDQNEDT